MKSLFVLGALATTTLGATIWDQTPRGNLRGAVSRSVGNVGGVRVALVGVDEANRGQWFRARADERGRFEIPRMTTGRFRAIATRGRWRAESIVRVDEAQTARLDLELERLLPHVPLDQPLRDEALVVRRTQDILGSLPRLSPQLLKIIRDNNRSSITVGDDAPTRALPLEILVAQAGAESSFRPALDGDLDEIGMFQLRPSTANDQGFGPIEPARLRDPATNTRLASRYLGRLSAKFGDLRVALAAYNQGQGRTEREGLYPSAQIYADAILRAASHPRLKNRLRELEANTPSEPKTASHAKTN